MLNWAIIGCGAISDIRIAPALKKSKFNRLAAFVSRSEEKAAAFSGKHEAEKSFASFDAMLENPSIDVVYLGTPNAVHAIQALAAIKARKHVFCEKPMALTIDDCEAMIRSAKEKGVKLGVGFNNRYNPVHLEAKRRLDSGDIGEVLFACVHFGLKGKRVDWRLEGELAGGGALMDMGVHGIDLLRFFVGREVVRVSAILDTSVFGWPLDEVASGIMEFEGGTHGLLNVSSKFPYARNGVEIYGSEGAILAIDTLVSQLKGGLPPSGYLELLKDGNWRKLDFAEEDIFCAELDAFANAIIGNHEPEISGIDGLKAQEIALAMQESSATGNVICLR